MSTDQDVVTRMATFVDPAWEAELDEKGFVVIDLLDPDQLSVLAEIVERVYVDERHGFHASNLSDAHEYRHAVSREVGPVIGEAVGDLFVDHETYTASLLMKWPDEDSAFHTHQDWTMVDEQRYRTVNVWCPLVDTDAGNGALRVLPGSHRVLDAIRCSPMPPSGCESVGWQVGWEEMEVVEVRAGQALVFDHALLHSSGPNLSGRPRPAVAAAFKPVDAELFHWYLPDPEDRSLEVFSIDPAFFADIEIGSRPDYEVVGHEEFGFTPMTKAELLDRCGMTPATTERDAPRAVLRDPAMQRQLDELGWVKVDLLDEATVDRLRRSYDELPHEISVDRSFAHGFHATIIDGRDDYRRRSHEAIATAVEAPFAALFDRMVLTLTNWLHKEPGAAAVPFHVDWSFVDESRARSFSVWAPLIDTDERSGCLGVVDRSHHEVTFVRAAAHPSYQETDAFGTTLDGAHLVELRAGEAIVFDHRLVHFSTPHLGAEPRVAISCELVPAEAELLHYERLGPGRFLRHRVEPEFFVTYAAGEDPRTVPGHLSCDEVAATSFDQLFPSIDPAPVDHTGLEVAPTAADTQPTDTGPGDTQPTDTAPGDTAATGAVDAVPDVPALSPAPCPALGRGDSVRRGGARIRRRAGATLRRIARGSRRVVRRGR